MRTPSPWSLGWRTLLRDLRAGELRLLIVAVTLAVAALTAVGFFADRLKSGLNRDARQLLGGDAVVVSDNPTPAAFVERARALGLQGVTTLVFPSMGRAPEANGGATRLVALKAVEPGYPLRGRLRIAEQPAGPSQSTTDVPARGDAWVDNPLLEALGLKVGDSLLLGDASLRIARVITYEPDRGGGFLTFAPRVMIHAADLPATGLVQPASRINWRYAIAGPDRAVADYLQWAQAEAARPDVRGVRVDPSLTTYTVQIVAATRERSDVLIGGSPRASLGLIRLAQARALLLGRTFVLPDDIKELAAAVLPHRIVMKATATAARTVVEEILTRVPVPVTTR